MSLKQPLLNTVTITYKFLNSCAISAHAMNPVSRFFPQFSKSFYSTIDLCESFTNYKLTEK